MTINITKPISIYIHFPFCEQKCLYCDFCSFANMADKQVAYVDKLVREIEYWGRTQSHRLYVRTIFLGGGTPSTMYDGAIRRVLNTVYQNFDCSKLEEVTIECNPNSVTRAKLDEYAENFVSRISLGVQSFDNSVLKGIGRLHDSAQAKATIQMIRQEGFDLSIDIMCGLPTQSVRSFASDIDTAIALEPDHISCYSLILEENTPLYKLVHQGQVALPTEDETIQMYDYAVKKLSKAGLEQYEVSNFSRNGKECLHNINYWQCGEYLGFGAGAHSHFDGCRFANPLTIEQYLALDTFEMERAFFFERIDMPTHKMEYIMLGLRMNKGICLNDYYFSTGEHLTITKHREIKMLEREKLLVLTPTHLYVPAQAMRLLNSIILNLV